MFKLGMALSITFLLGACTSTGKRRMAGELVEDVLKGSKTVKTASMKRCPAGKAAKGKHCARPQSQKLAAK